jgi:hypothetical protein
MALRIYQSCTEMASRCSMGTLLRVTIRKNHFLALFSVALQNARCREVNWRQLGLGGKRRQVSNQNNIVTTGGVTFLAFANKIPTERHNESF